MGKINLANLKKSIYYLKRNGMKNTWYAVWERLEERKAAPYCFVPVTEEKLQEQRRWSADKTTVFSIVVPCYRTNETYLQEMIESVVEQSYPHWELILADATEDDSVGCAVRRYTEERGISPDICSNLDNCNTGAHSYNAEELRAKQAEQMINDEDVKAGKQLVARDKRGGVLRYIKLAQNIDIATNTNEALKYVSGDYVGLLDHDDVLTPDALYEMAVRIEEGKKQNQELKMLYSDEDKCNGERTSYYEPHFKEHFNLDLLLSNNYICHFLVMKTELIKELAFRAEYSGAQDYDLVLRAAQKLHEEEESIVHVPKVLYHWRCHTGSTAENPQSKQYAYEAGLLALQDYADKMNYHAKAVHLKHLGFYRLEYPEGVFNSRPDIGAVGGSISASGQKTMDDNAVVGGRENSSRSIRLGKKRIISGRMTAEGRVFYQGLPVAYSGYMHRAVLTQDAEAVDIRCIQVREECRKLFEEIVGVPYIEVLVAETKQNTVVPSRNSYKIFDATTLPPDADIKKISLNLSQALRDAGYRILYLPTLQTEQ